VEKTVDLLLSLHDEDSFARYDNPGLISINAYPNPVKGNLIIEDGLSVGANIGVSVYDILGKETMKKNEGYKVKGQHLINYGMSGLKPGVYYLSVSLDGKQAYTTKLVKR